MALFDKVRHGFEVLHEVVKAKIAELLPFSICCNLLLC